MSVRKRTWKSPNGEIKSNWVVDYSDAQGRRRLKTFARKRDADAFHARATTEVGDGVHVADRATVTVREAGKGWLTSAINAGLERATVAQYRQHLALHIEPFIGDRRLNELTVPLVRSFQDQLRAAGRSPTMVRRVTVSLGAILGDAQARGLVMRNVVSEMARQRTIGARVQERQKARLAYGTDIPTMEEVRAILSGAEGRYRPLIVVALLTGMRASELRGLRWQDVDLAKNCIAVHQRADRYQSIGAPKSSAGRRTIPLPPLAANTLREWKLACPKGELGLVFPNGAGNVESLGNMTRRGLWATQLAAGVVKDTGEKDEEGNPILGAKYTGWHAFRHWFASWAINRRVDGGLELSAKMVQERLGHSSITMTMDRYGHLFPALDEADALAAAEKSLLGNAT
ncbi:site-specific integrase [Acuticoccus sp. M5D2P5]|uniref:tyrosine-type recombinase/integrase n=1 Tax=Acuticoccus kalidii TaxID=2910977 RepID=UPI001F27F291|nr:site-specific integrase [Acuticoccus kalidii]MCF3935265.1 site-specific integrase [Acuticoccus kalidii]